MELLERTRQQSWYHTLELAPGVVTEGMFDLRPLVDRYGLPARMDGLRALDVGTWDGFWAFEMERRGADVVALDLDDERDLDWPADRRPAAFPAARRGDGFRLASEVLGSSVERVDLSVYDASPGSLGTFDLVFCGSVLIHLRDQLLALERLAALCGGTLICAEGYDRLLGLLPFPAVRYQAGDPRSIVFWRPSARAWKAMLRSAGFASVREHARFRLRSRAGWSVPHVVLHASKGAAGSPR
jgi:tRNA (mo5U34)-methyltransferase